jgi:alkane 1-monooxygenase
MIRYAGPFLLLLSVPLFFYGLGPAGPLASVGLLLAALLGAEKLSPRGAVAKCETASRVFRFLPRLYVPFQIAIVVWALGVVGQASALGAASLVLAVGVTTGVFGMLAAHELIHSRDRTEHVFGTVMLSVMAYRHFRIAHVHGHHRWAATARDSATARLGEGFYAFLVRTVVGQLREAWRFEQRRCAERHLSFFGNRVIGDAAVMAALAVAISGIWGWPGLAFLHRPLRSAQADRCLRAHGTFRRPSQLEQQQRRRQSPDLQHGPPLLSSPQTRFVL